jgi:hypothetical protein
MKLNISKYLVKVEEIIINFHKEQKFRISNYFSTRSRDVEELERSMLQRCWN